MIQFCPVRQTLWPHSQRISVSMRGLVAASTKASSSCSRYHELLWTSSSLGSSVVWSLIFSPWRFSNVRRMASRRRAPKVSSPIFSGGTTVMP